MLNGLYVGLLVTIALHGGLFYWQMWKSLKDNDGKKNEEEIEEEEEKIELKEKDREHTQHQNLLVDAIESNGEDVDEMKTFLSCQHYNVARGKDES